jgi:hypothetical protein
VLLSALAVLLLQEPPASAPAVEVPVHELKLRPGMIGGVKLMCQIDENARVSECAVVQELPQGQGYGAEALSMLRRGTRVRQEQVEGLTLPASVNLNFYFSELPAPPSPGN